MVMAITRTLEWALNFIDTKRLPATPIVTINDERLIWERLKINSYN